MSNCAHIRYIILKRYAACGEITPCEWQSNVESCGKKNWGGRGTFDPLNNEYVPSVAEFILLKRQEELI